MKPSDLRLTINDDLTTENEDEVWKKLDERFIDKEELIKQLKKIKSKLDRNNIYQNNRAIGIEDVLKILGDEE